MEQLTLRHLSINPNYITAYNPIVNSLGEIVKATGNKENLRDNKHEGFISVNASKRLVKVINWFLFISNYSSKMGNIKYTNKENRLKMITLTLSSKQRHSDIWIKKNLLEVFLKWMRNNYKINLYIWRAEKQRNGNIHFHILVNKYIKWQEIRAYWNKLQNKKGYLKDYKNKFKKYNPNSIDIHNLYSKKNIGAYISKYMAKKYDRETEDGRKATEKYKIEGRIWFICRELSKVKNIVITEAEQVFDFIRIWVNRSKVVIKEYKYCRLIFGDILYKAINGDRRRSYDLRKLLFENIKGVIDI